MAMRFPLLTQELERAIGQGDVTIVVAFAGADVQEPASGIDVAHLQTQAFTQSQAAGVDGDEANAMIQRGHLAKDAAHFRGGEHDREFELGIGAHQFQFGRPGTFKGFFPEEFEGANDLGGSLTGDFLVGLEMDAILAELFGGDQLGGFVAELAQLANTGVIGLLGARADGQQFEVIGE